MSKPPNILWLMSDEHRADVLGYAGNPIIRTPVLDALASRGVIFNNAYTPSPICVPSRQCIAVGRTASSCGVERYGQDLPPQSTTIARWFAEHGYTTCCAGKLHHMGEDQMQGWTRRIGMDTAVNRPVTRGNAPVKPGSETGLTKWSDAKEVRRAGVGHGTTNHDYDKLALEGALTYISEYFSDPFYDRPSSHQPLMLKVSLNRPHYPYFTDEDRFNYYLNRVQPYFDQEVSGHPFLSKHRVRIGEDVTPRDVQRATAAYYGMIDEVDHDFGQIVQALHQHGQNLDEWIILFTADHGEMLGEHGVWEKQVFYEASAKVPLFIRPPQAGPARHIDANVSTCDLFATLCDLVGFDLPPDRSLTPAGKLDSRSLVGLMTGDATEWDDYAVSEFEGLNLMLKHGNLKYQYYARESCDRPEHREVLFDLSRDPLESRNVFDDPGYAEAMQRFREHPLTEDYRNRAKG